MTYAWMSAKYYFPNMRSDYAFATGLIRALEPSLPDDTDLERMIDAPDAARAFEVLNDTDYADNLLDVEPADYYSALQADWSQLRDLLEMIVPNKKLVTLLYLKEDFNNLKIILKDKFQGKDLAESQVTDSGSVSHEAWASFWQEGAGDLAECWIESLNEVLSELSENPVPQDIDRAADKVYLARIVQLSDSLSDRFLKVLVQVEIDVTNAKAMLRAKNLDRDENFLSAQLIAGGSIDQSEITEWLELEEVDIIKKFHQFFPSVIGSAVEANTERGLVETLERAYDSWQRDYLRQADYSAYGPEAVLKYFQAKVTALRNVRTVMSGKLNDLAPEDIKQRIAL
jgi:V/A-type H+/Na+-transporting ATPase subunit C